MKTREKITKSVLGSCTWSIHVTIYMNTVCGYQSRYGCSFSITHTHKHTQRERERRQGERDKAKEKIKQEKVEVKNI